jgi:hypothetical protein
MDMRCLYAWRLLLDRILSSTAHEIACVCLFLSALASMPMLVWNWSSLAPEDSLIASAQPASLLQSLLQPGSDGIPATPARQSSLAHSLGPSQPVAHVLGSRGNPVAPSALSGTNLFGATVCSPADPRLASSLINPSASAAL